MAVLGALLLLSHLSLPPGSCRHLGLAQPLLWHLGELQALPLSRAAGSLWRLKHRDQSSVAPVPLTSPTDPLVPRAGAPVRHFPFPLLGQRPELSNEEGKEALLSLAWERGAPGRAQEAAEHGAHPEVSPLHVAISTSAGPGLCPGWLQPWFPSAALGSAGVGAQPSILGAGWAVPHGAAPAAVAWTSLWF